MPTDDVVMEFMAMVKEVKVLEPSGLVDEITSKIKESLAQYF